MSGEGSRRDSIAIAEEEVDQLRRELDIDRMTLSQACTELVK